MSDDRTKPYLGPLLLASDALRARLDAVPSFRALMARGWSPEKTLIYVPRKLKGYDLDVVVLGRTYAKDERSQVIWILSTVGLCNVEQPARPDRPGFRRFELVLATNNAEREDPFPTRLGVALAMGAEGLPAWDWSQVQVPPLLDWLTIAGEELGSAIRQGSQFAFCDTLTLGPGKAPWTRSQLDHSILLPASPPLLAAGFEPFDHTAPVGVVPPDQWNRAPGHDRHEHGFFWLVPVSRAEYDKANAAGSWDVFADLVERALSAGRDEFSDAFDLLRKA
jgi:hypothetical protein